MRQWPSCRPQSSDSAEARRGSLMPASASVRPPSAAAAAFAAAFGTNCGRSCVALAATSRAPAPRPGALLRLAGTAQDRRPAVAEPQLREPAGRQRLVRRGAAGRADSGCALPHLEVGLGSVPHVARQLVAALAAQRLEPVGV